MARDNRILAIDVGADSLKMAEFVYTSAGGMIIDKFAFRRIDVPAEGEYEAPSFGSVYNEMIKEHGFTARKVRLSLSVQSAFLRLSKLPALMASSSAISKVVEYEAKQTVPYAMSEIEWDYQLLLHRWQETRDVTKEDGSIEQETEDCEEYEALFAAMKCDGITLYTDVIQDSGKDILSVSLAPVQLYNAATAAGQIGEDECVLMLNIGSRATSLVIADGKRVFMRSIPIAGYSITTQISKEFNIKIAEAEDLKRRYGFVALGGAYEEPESELAAMISKISRNVMTRLHGEISRSINVWRSAHGGRQPGRMLLSGGGSTMTYVPEFFHEKLRINAQYLNTFAVTAIGQNVDREELQNTAPMVQELIGLALEAMPNLPLSISLLPRAVKKQHELDRRKPFFYISSAILVVSLLIFSMGITQMRIYNENRLKIAQSEVEKVEKKQKEINALMGEMTGARDGLNSLRGYLTDRNRWPELMKELNRLTPDTMWYTAIEGFAQDPPKPSSDADAPAENPAPEQENVTSAAQAELSRINSMTEINFLRLRGCTLLIDSKSMPLEQAFKNSIEGNEFFESADIRIYRGNKAHNITEFEIVVKLKNTIRK